jgi:flagellar biosynthesis protein FlhF
MLTEHALSYTTTGQNVPDDITVVNVQQIAKELLGGAFE